MGDTPVSVSRLLGRVVAILDAMDRTAIIEILRKYDAALRENGSTGLFIFGSRARGTHRPDATWISSSTMTLQ
jgi:hypothetical protein